ncbi:MAG: rhodanese-like domain-containing protein [Chitinivibrionales bacterium]
MKTFKISSFLSVLFFLNVSGANAAVINISADTLTKWITVGTAFDFLLIDVRDTSELTSVIATDLCRPYNLSWNQGAFKSTLSKLPKTANYVLYCKSGGRSGMASQMLVDSGYVSVYSLTGGMNGWTGPTKTSASLKPASDLPAPSMLKATVGVVWAGVQSNRAKYLIATPGALVIGAPLAEGHQLVIFDLQGRRVVQAEDPFVSNTRFILPQHLSNGTYIARLLYHGKTTFMLLCHDIGQ